MPQSSPGKPLSMASMSLIFFKATIKSSSSLITSLVSGLTSHWKKSKSLPQTPHCCGIWANISPVPLSLSAPQRVLYVKHAAHASAHAGVHFHKVYMVKFLSSSCFSTFMQFSMPSHKCICPHHSRRFSPEQAHDMPAIPALGSSALNSMFFKCGSSLKYMSEAASAPCTSGSLRQKALLSEHLGGTGRYEKHSYFFGFKPVFSRRFPLPACTTSTGASMFNKFSVSEWYLISINCNMAGHAVLIMGF